LDQSAAYCLQILTLHEIVRTSVALDTVMLIDVIITACFYLHICRTDKPLCFWLL